MAKRIEAAELWFLRMLRIQWVEKLSNEKILEKAKLKESWITSWVRGLLQER